MTHENHISNGLILRARTRVSGTDYLMVFRYFLRHKWIPVLGLFMGAGIAAGILVLTPPLYSASSRILIEGHAGALRSEMEIIESTPVLSKVAGVLGLYRDARFNRESVLEKALPNGNEENALRDRVLGRLARMLEVRQVADTNIIAMTVRHPNPDRAAQIANVVLSSYKERKMDERFEQSRQLGDWMSGHIETVRSNIENSKKQLEEFQAKNGLAVLGGTDTKIKHIQLLNDEITETGNALSTLEAQLETLRKSGVQRIRTPDSALKKEEQKLVQELDGLLQRYGAKHPKVVAQKTEIGRVRARMSRKTADPAKGVESEIASSKSKLANLKAELEEISKGFDQNGRIKMQLDALQADVETNERLYENLLVKFQDMMAQAEMHDAGMTVVSMATIPSKPDRHERIKFVLALGFAGFVVGFMLVLVRALCNTGFTSADQLEGMTGYPVFAAIPNGSMKGVAVHHTIIENPAAIMAESLRSLRVALRLRSSALRGPRVVAFTSTLPDEGKTSLAVMLAMIAAKSGERVVIVDCDLRRPSLHRVFGIGNARGLQDYLGNDSTLDDAIYRKDKSGVHLITAKSVPSYSLTLLTSGRMEQLIESLREQYDLVILDAPSSLAFADARVLARMVDQTLYVVAWNRTRREGVLSSLKSYADMGYEDLALVLNKVDMREYLRESASAVIYQYGREHDSSEQRTAA